MGGDDDRNDIDRVSEKTFFKRRHGRVDERIRDLVATRMRVAAGRVFVKKVVHVPVRPAAPVQAWRRPVDRTRVFRALCNKMAVGFTDRMKDKFLSAVDGADPDTVVDILHTYWAMNPPLNSIYVAATRFLIDRRAEYRGHVQTAVAEFADGAPWRIPRLPDGADYDALCAYNRTKSTVSNTLRAFLLLGFSEAANGIAVDAIHEIETMGAADAAVCPCACLDIVKQYVDALVADGFRGVRAPAVKDMAYRLGKISRTRLGLFQSKRYAYIIDDALEILRRRPSR